MPHIYSGCRVPGGVRRDCVIWNLWWFFPVPIWVDIPMRAIYTAIYLQKYVQHRSSSTIVLVSMSVRSRSQLQNDLCRSRVDDQTLELSIIVSGTLPASSIPGCTADRILLCYVTSGGAACRRPDVQFGPAPNKNNEKENNSGLAAVALDSGECWYPTECLVSPSFVILKCLETSFSSLLSLDFLCELAFTWSMAAILGFGWSVFTKIGSDEYTVWNEWNYIDFKCVRKPTESITASGCFNYSLSQHQTDIVT